MVSPSHNKTRHMKGFQTLALGIVRSCTQKLSNRHECLSLLFISPKSTIFRNSIVSVQLNSLRRYYLLQYFISERDVIPHLKITSNERMGRSATVFSSPGDNPNSIYPFDPSNRSQGIGWGANINK